ncbi:MAG: hypothetical protein NTV94_08785 [Planctomycetota bacterium]|nr:hypothetical protein [Planctomycetota bacterium]
MNITRNFAFGLAMAALVWNESNVLGQPTSVLPEHLNEAQQRMMLSVSAQHQLMTFSRIYALRAHLILPKDAPVWELWVNDWTHRRRIPTSSAPALSRSVSCDQRAADSWKYVFTFNGVVAPEYAGGASLTDQHPVACAIALTRPLAIESTARLSMTMKKVTDNCMAPLTMPQVAGATMTTAPSNWSPETRKSDVMVAFSPDVALI